VLFVAIAAGAIWFYIKTKNDFIRLNILNIFLFIFAFGMLNSARHMHYYSDIYYSVFLVIAYALYYFSKNKVVSYAIIPLFLIIYIALNAHNYYYFWREPNNQIRDAKMIAESIIPHVDKTPYQIVPLPIAITDGHIRYFLEIEGKRPLDYDSAVQGQELFVLCFYGSKCNPTGDPQWQIASFQNKKVVESWKLELVTIYKLVHGK
jgi:hypothetical protein